MEDFSVKSQSEGPIYPNLSKKLTEVETDFMPSVSNPLKAIHLLRDTGYDWVHYHGKVPVDLKNPTVIVVALEDSAYGGDRSEILRAHDKKIARIYEAVDQRYPNTLALYTGRKDAWVEAEKELNRVRRADKADEPEEQYSGIVIMENKVAVIANSITFYPDKDSPKNLSSVSSVSVGNDTEALTLVATFSTGETLKFVFNSDASTAWQWFLLNIIVNDKTLSAPDTIWAPMDWSYYCGNILFKGEEEYPRIIFGGLQVQPNVDGEFGQPIDCVPYFSMAIWSGILISALLLFIMAWGITMLMDINNNDRFDDPKGKTITITATD